MLAQEDLGEIGLSSPSEQVAYLLVERATLLERLEAVERRLESQSLTDNLKDVCHQVKDWLHTTSIPPRIIFFMFFNYKTEFSKS